MNRPSSILFFVGLLAIILTANSSDGAAFCPLTTTSSLGTKLDGHRILYQSQQQGRQHLFEPTRIRAPALLASTNDNDNTPFSKNEFSRLVDSERLVKLRNKDYTTEIEATEAECQALAQRFSLPNISTLRAVVNLRREFVGTSIDADGGITMEGTAWANVTRICVRTAELFDAQLEIPMYSIVRPIMPLATLLAQQQALEEQFNSKSNNDSRGSNKKNRKKQSAATERRTSMDDMDVLQLQRMLQQDITDEDDVVMEDEAIYPTDGKLDVGELVAQLFWLSLDPYPKKPGTGPVQISITG